MTDLRTAAQQALEALEKPNAGLVPHNGEWMSIQSIAITSLRAALEEPVLERNFCSRCGKRSFPDTIHTCTPPHGIGEQQ